MVATYPAYLGNEPLPKLKRSAGPSAHDQPSHPKFGEQLSAAPEVRDGFAMAPKTLTGSMEGRISQPAPSVPIFTPMTHLNPSQPPMSETHEAQPPRSGLTHAFPPQSMQLVLAEPHAVQSSQVQSEQPFLTQANHFQPGQPMLTQTHFIQPGQPVHQETHQTIAQQPTLPANAQNPRSFASQAPVIESKFFLHGHENAPPQSVMHPIPEHVNADRAKFAHPLEQLMHRLDLKPEDFISRGYFEKMSSGSVFWRKTGVPIGIGTTVLSFATLATALGLKGTAAAAAWHAALFAKIPYVIATAPAEIAGKTVLGAGAGAAVGAKVATGIGAGILAAAIATYVGIAVRRTSKVRKEYKRLLEEIKNHLRQEGNEEQVGFYLRTKQITSAKKKARKSNAKTLNQLNEVQNPQIPQPNIFKIYVRYVRNQNLVLLTRSPQRARDLIQKASMVASDHQADKQAHKYMKASTDKKRRAKA